MKLALASRVIRGARLSSMVTSYNVRRLVWGVTHTQAATAAQQRVRTISFSRRTAARRASGRHDVRLQTSARR